MSFKFKITLLDKVTSPLKKMNSLFGKTTKLVGKTQKKIDFLPNSIAGVESKLEKLRHAQKTAFTVQGIKHYQKEINKTERDLSRLSKGTQSTGNRMRGLGTSIAGGVGLYSLVSIGNKSIEMWDTQQKSVAQVKQGLRTTNNVAGKSLDGLMNYASELQSKTLFGDEDILQNATAQILTFTNITGKQFDRTQMAALNLSTRLGGDLKSSSIQLGKALNDPIANLSALSRSGIQFTDEQKDLVKSLWETGKKAEAQNIILDELDKQYGGSAEAAALAGSGGLTQLQNKLGDVQEQLGGLAFTFVSKMMPAIDSLINTMSSLFTWLGKHEGIMKMLAIGIGGVIVAISLWIPIQWALNVALNANPISAVVMAVIAMGVGITILVVKMNSIVAWFKKLNTISKIFVGIIAVIAAALLPVLAPMFILAFVIRKLIDNWKKITSVINTSIMIFTALSDAVSIIVTKIKNKLIGELVPVILKIKQKFIDIKNKVVDTFNSIKNGIINFIIGIRKKIKPITSVLASPFLKIKDIIFGVFQKIFDFLTERFAFIGVLAEKLGLKDIAKTFKTGFSESVKEQKSIDLQKKLGSSITGGFNETGKKEKRIIPVNDTSPITDVTTTPTNDIVTGGKTQKNITINLGSLIEKSELIVQYAQEGIDDIENKIQDALLRILNSANAI